MEAEAPAAQRKREKRRTRQKKWRKGQGGERVQREGRLVRGGPNEEQQPWPPHAPPGEEPAQQHGSEGESSEDEVPSSSAECSFVRKSFVLEDPVAACVEAAAGMKQMAAPHTAEAMQAGIKLLLKSPSKAARHAAAALAAGPQPRVPTAAQEHSKELALRVRGK